MKNIRKQFLKQNKKLQKASKCSTINNIGKKLCSFRRKSKTFIAKYASVIQLPVVNGKCKLYKRTSHINCAQFMNGMLCAMTLEDIAHTGSWRPIRLKNEKMKIGGIQHLFLELLKKVE